MSKEVTIPGLGWQLSSDRDYQVAFEYLIQTDWKFSIARYEDDIAGVGILVNAPYEFRDYFNLDPTDYDIYVGVEEFASNNTTLDEEIGLAFNEAIEKALETIGEIFFTYRTQVEGFRKYYLTGWVNHMGDHDEAENETV